MHKSRRKYFIFKGRWWTHAFYCPHIRQPNQTTLDITNILFFNSYLCYWYLVLSVGGTKPKSHFEDLPMTWWSLRWCLFEDGLLWTFDTEKYVESNFQKLLDSTLGLSTQTKKNYSRKTQNLEVGSWSRESSRWLLWVILQQTTLDITNILYSFSIAIYAINIYSCHPEILKK